MNHEFIPSLFLIGSCIVLLALSILVLSNVKQPVSSDMQKSPSIKLDILILTFLVLCVVITGFSMKAEADTMIKKNLLQQSSVKTNEQ